MEPESVASSGKMMHASADSQSSGRRWKNLNPLPPPLHLRDDGETLCVERTTGLKRQPVCNEIRFVSMKKYICLLAGVALLAACEQKETTVTNPPAEKKESTTTIIKESPAAATKEKTEVNVNTSPNP
jgi:hypothetical protein